MSASAFSDDYCGLSLIAAMESRSSKVEQKAHCIAVLIDFPFSSHQQLSQPWTSLVLPLSRRNMRPAQPGIVSNTHNFTFLLVYGTVKADEGSRNDAARASLGRAPGLHCLCGSGRYLMYYT